MDIANRRTLAGSSAGLWKLEHRTAPFLPMERQRYMGENAGIVD